MKKIGSRIKSGSDRRSFLKTGMAAAGAATVGAGLLTSGVSAFAEEKGGRLDAGDAAILRFLAAADWGPAILAAPTTRLLWTAFVISWAIAGAAWLVAQNITPKQPAMPDV